MDNIEKVKCEILTLLNERNLLNSRIKNKIDEFQKVCKNFTAEIHKTSNNNSIDFITTQDISERQTYYLNKYGLKPSPNEAIVLDIAKELKTVTSHDIAIRLGITKRNANCYLSILARGPFLIHHNLGVYKTKE